MPDKMDFLLDLLNQRPHEAWKWRFEPKTRAFSAINAVALANAALLAYSSQDDVRRFLAKWDGLDLSTFTPFRRADTQGFVISGLPGVIVSFRGTEPMNIADWISDVNFHQIKSNDLPGLIHGGFAKAFEVVKNDVLGAIDRLASDGEPIWITGHSLGGALAVLTAAALHFELGVNHIAGVYTYGQPRVGDKEFCELFDDALGDRLFRIVNDQDIVPHAPPVSLPHLQLLRLPHLHRIGSLNIQEAVAVIEDELETLAEDEVFGDLGDAMLFRADGTLITDKFELETAWSQRETPIGKSFAEVLRELPSLLRESLNARVLSGARVLDHDPLNGYLPKLASLSNQPDWRQCYPAKG